MWSAMWKILRKAAEKIIIAYSAYTVGETQNDAEKITDAIIKINNHQSAQQLQKLNDDEDLISYALILAIIILLVIVLIFLVRFLSARAVNEDRRIRRTNIATTAQSEC